MKRGQCKEEDKDKVLTTSGAGGDVQRLKNFKNFSDLKRNQKFVGMFLYAMVILTNQTHIQFVVGASCCGKISIYYVSIPLAYWAMASVLRLWRAAPAQRECSWDQVPELLTFTCFAIRLKRESHRAAASDPCGCVLTRPVATAIVDGAGLCTQQDRDMQRGRIID